MSDLYSQLVNSFPGRLVAGRVGLPQPTKLERHAPGSPVVSGPVLLGGAPGGRLGDQLERVLGEIGAKQASDSDDASGARLRRHRHRRLHASWSSCSASSIPT